MNWLDWIILFVLALPTFSGLRYGLASMLAVGVLAVAGLLAARILSGPFREMVAFASDDPTQQAAAVYVILTAIGGIIAVLLGALLERYIKLLPTGVWRDRIASGALGLVIGDRIAGGALGLVIGALIVTAILTGFIVVAPDELGEFVRSGAVGRYLSGPFHDRMATLCLVPWYSPPEWLQWGWCWVW